MNKKLIAAIILIIILITTALFALSTYANNKYIQSKIKRVSDEQKTIEIAVNSKYIDDCNGFKTSPGNYLPESLSTPIAYVKPDIYYDPFSPSHERYKFINQLNRGNGAEYLIVSRGPDLDWDINRLPMHAVTHQPYKTPDDIKSIKHEENLVWDDESQSYIPPKEEFVLGKVEPRKKQEPIDVWKPGKGGYIVEDGEYFLTQSGKRIDVPTMDILVLPVNTPNGGWLKYPELIEYLANSNIAIYDPTNGLKSDGDIIRTDANR